MISCKPAVDKKKLSDEVSMQLLSFDDEGTTYKKNQFISASLLLFEGKTMLYNRFYHQPFQAENKLFQLIFSTLNSGDSAVFFIETTALNGKFMEVELPKITANQLQLVVKIHHYFDEEKMNQFINNLDKDLVEQQYLNFYIKNIAPTAVKKSGIYIEKRAEGKGQSIKKNDIIRVKYKGYFLNHIVFDETPNDGFLELEYGTPQQVIKGLNIAIKNMKIGEKSKIIIPSHLAFGKNGSSTGIIPPTTPVAYEVEILTIN